MTRAASGSLCGQEFNDSLFAPIVENKKGIRPGVLLMLDTDWIKRTVVYYLSCSSSRGRRTCSKKPPIMMS